MTLRPDIAPGDWDLTPKPASASAITLTVPMDLTDANLLGNVHGGAIMRLVDNAGGLAAMKHCGGPVVTAAMDEMSFLEPVYVGDVVTVNTLGGMAVITKRDPQAWRRLGDFLLKAR